MFLRKIKIIIFIFFHISSQLVFSISEKKYFASYEEEVEFYERFRNIYNNIGYHYENHIKRVNKKLSEEETKNIAKSIIFYTMLFNRGEAIQIDPRLIVAIVQCESKFRIKSVSPKGALGLGQIMPYTAKEHNVEYKFLFHPILNIYGTVKIFRNYLNRYRHLQYPYQLSYALAAYNAGPSAVEKFGGIPPYPETQNYVYNVMRLYSILSSGR